jgi:hypothetical protein
LAEGGVSALTAGLWGALAASSLLAGAALAIWLRPSDRIVGLVMGFGSGSLISAVAYEQVPGAAPSLTYERGEHPLKRQPKTSREDGDGGCSRSLRCR